MFGVMRFESIAMKKVKHDTQICASENLPCLMSGTITGDDYNPTLNKNKPVASIYAHITCNCKYFNYNYIHLYFQDMVWHKRIPDSYYRSIHLKPCKRYKNNKTKDTKNCY